MKQLFLILFSLLAYSCQDLPYEKIEDKETQKLTVQKIVVSNNKVEVKTVGDSISDPYSRLLLKTKDSNYYLFNYDCQLENDSIVLAYGDAFIIDDEGEFRKNGIWVYATFTSHGTFPFITNSIHYAVDSVPDKSIKLPTKEGLYLYEKGSLKFLSDKQSDEKFKEERRNGFYFIPNKGRFFNRININSLE